MSVGVEGFCGPRLSEARLARGMSKKSLGEAVGLSDTAISRYENGQDNPHEMRLHSIAERLVFPYNFFFRPVWDENIERVFWRSQAAETKRARSMTEQRMIWACELFSTLERDLEFPPDAVPDLGLPSQFSCISDEVIEQAAEDLRFAWKLGDRPIPDVMLALENVGIPVLALEIMSEKQDGFFFRSERLKRSFVGINTLNVSCARARYDASHELGHAVLHRAVSTEQINEPSFLKIIEQQAHRFAAAFLFPRSAFRHEVRGISLDYLSNIKRRWGISIAAMIYRAHDLGIIDADERLDLYKKMARRGWKGPLKEPFDNPRVMPLEEPRMLKRGIEALLADNIFRYLQVEAEMAMPAGEIENISGVRAEYFKQKISPEFVRVRKSEGLKAMDLVSGNVIELSHHRQKR